ncbi:16S rRNA (guanine(527)-N(7))-methyltransferase RsmG [soil metagenome]
MLAPAASTPRPRPDGQAPTLDELVRAAGISLDPEHLDRLKRYRDLLFKQNQSTNLTAVRDLPGIERRLILESFRLIVPLRALPRINDARPQSLIDIGTGGGLPGMVLAIACPDLNVFLLDATGKKVAFLDLAIGELGLGNVVTIHARAEEIGHRPRFRGGFDVVTARAVSSLPALFELGLPLLRVGGSLLLPKGVEIAEELAAADRAAEILGGKIVDTGMLPDLGSTIETRLVVVRKVIATPPAYPRRAGIPARSPLGSNRIGQATS